jgi:hypothetical protein
MMFILTLTMALGTVYLGYLSVIFAFIVYDAFTNTRSKSQ